MMVLWTSIPIFSMLVDSQVKTLKVLCASIRRFQNIMRTSMLELNNSPSHQIYKCSTAASLAMN